MAVREGRIRRLILCVPPRHLKSLLASVAFPAWCLGHDPSAQILCVSYAQELYLLHVLRKRMEYPKLKRPVREQCEAFEASVVLRTRPRAPS